MSQNNSLSNNNIFPRELNEHEKLVLKTILEKAPSPKDNFISTSQRAKLIKTIPSLKVVGQCDCGSCCSIEFNKNYTPKERYTLEASTPEALIILFVDDNELSYLELAPFEHDKAFTSFPKVEELEF